MLQRENYIKRIIGRLSELQVYVEMNNAAGLLDVNIIAEDFIGGLLNQIYGYQLENLNHQVRNAPAVDLVDNKRRIFIQVTADKTREKIQTTIDKFIEDKSYNQYDKLIFFLLTDSPEYRKPFATKGVLLFDHRHDVWCMKELAKEIRKKDIDVLKDIDTFLEKELVKHPEITRLPLKGEHTKKIKPVLISALVILLCFVGALYIFHSGGNRVGTVYFSKLQPYTAAGFYTSYEAIPFKKDSPTEVKKAFSILSFLRNEGDSASVVEEVHCKILNLELIEEAVLVPDAVIEDNTLKFYIFNNGWSDAEKSDITIESKVSDRASDIGTLEVISQCTYMEDCLAIPSAGVLSLAEYKLDSGKFEEICETYGCSELYVSLEGNRDGENVFTWGAYLYCAEGTLQMDYGGFGGPEYQVTLFAVLDVDSAPSDIFFTGQDATSIVEDALVLETVIAPTKSCIVECRNIFRINGKLQQTPDYTIKVMVPAFKDGAISRSGALTRELAQLSSGDRAGKERLILKYLYQAESIRDAFSTDD